MKELLTPGSKVAIYLRVSDIKQNHVLQMAELSKLIKSHNLILSHEPFIDTITGDFSKRPGLDALKEYAKTKEFDTLLIWAMDRLSREGISGTYKQLDYFKDLGIKVISHQEPYLSAEDETTELLTAIISWKAKSERLRHNARVKAALAAKRWSPDNPDGLILGRPREELSILTILEYLKQGKSIRQIAKETVVGCRSCKTVGVKNNINCKHCNGTGYRSISHQTICNKLKENQYEQPY